MDYRKLFLSEMIGLSLMLLFFPIPLLSLIILPLIIAICGFYYSYLFALGSVYFGILLRPGEPATAFIIAFLLKLSSVTRIPSYVIFGVGFGVVLPIVILVSVLVIYRPIRYLTRKALKNRVNFGCK